MKRNRTVRTVSRGVAALVTLGALSGCGGLNPGTALQVGDQRISEEEVDETARAVCTALQSDPRAIAGGYPRQVILRSVVEGYLLRTVAEQLAAERGVEPGEDYKAAVEQANLQLASVDEGVRDRAIASFTASSYFLDVITAAGERDLAEKGEPATSPEAAQQRGIELAREWEAKHGVEVAPRFPDLTIGEQAVDGVPSETSFPVSDFAKAAGAARPDPAWVASLPPSQKCLPKA